jgi:diacylglycerol kinase family enzyme
MLVIVNPYATTVSDRLKNLVVYALQSRYEVEAVDTQAKHHATELCREAAEEGYEVVVAFGGDGTVNEAANGLIGTEVPLTCLPGGSTNVFCRSLGIPRDLVDATEHLLQLADHFEPRRVDLGRVNGRHFTFSSGIGLDASVVEQVDAHPTLKSRYTRWYYTYVAVTQFMRKYLVSPPRVAVEVDGRRIEGVTVIVQNSDPFTYFGPRPIRVCENAGLDNGTLSLTVLERAAVRDMPTLISRLFSARAKTVQRHRQVVGFSAIEYAQIHATEGTFPLQVDGDYIGDFAEASYGVVPRALTVVA